ncbi:DUF6182 family protein [Nonomuraea fuscirosea]|uniref:DUF6182 family protein n=1 Tax=Nonomuraea fuscirosea TaxID=1291556 RepID=UPI0034293529
MTAPPPTLEQRLLRIHLDARLARVRQARSLHRTHDDYPVPAPDTGVIAVLRTFDPATFVTSAHAFASALPPSRSAPWYAAWTRTIFLAGDPANLATRHPFDHVSPDGSIAWYAPAPLPSREGLRRLLRPFRGPRALPAPRTQQIPLPNGPATPMTARLDIPVTALPVEAYLIHVNHLIAEATLDGLLTKVTHLRLTHVPHPPDPTTSHTRIRVTPDPTPADRLRPHAYLTVPS